MSDKYKEAAGSYLRGEDGRFFYIPDSSLESFAVDKDQVENLNAIFETLVVGSSKNLSRLGLKGPEDATTSFLDLGAFRRNSPDR